MIEAVPWPLMIFPSDTIQLNVSLAAGLPPDTFAEKVNIEPKSESGQVTTTPGQSCE
jgi:hypothetical protein